MHALLVFEQRRRVSGVDVEHRTQVFVVRADKRWGAAHAIGRLHHPAIQSDGEVGERVRFVQCRRTKQLAGAGVKSLLHGGGDIQSFVALAGDINQQKHQPPMQQLKIEEIAAGARGSIQRGQVRRLQIRHHAGQRLAQRALWCGVMERQFHGGPSGDATKISQFRRAWRGANQSSG